MISFCLFNNKNNKKKVWMYQKMSSPRVSRIVQVATPPPDMDMDKEDVGPLEEVASEDVLNRILPKGKKRTPRLLPPSPSEFKSLLSSSFSLSCSRKRKQLASDEKVPKPKSHKKLKDCALEAKATGDSVLVKFGPINCSDFQHFKDMHTFYEAFMQLGAHRCAWEVFHEDQERMLYFDLDAYYPTRPSPEFKMGVIDSLARLVDRTLEIKSKFITLDSSRPIKEKGHKHDGLFKISLHIVYYNLKCPANYSLAPLVATLETAAKQDSEASKHLFNLEDGKNVFMLDKQVYKRTASLRTAFSYKVKFGSTGAPQIYGDIAKHLPTSYDVNWDACNHTPADEKILEYSFISNAKERFTFDDTEPQPLLLQLIPERFLAPSGEGRRSSLSITCPSDESTELLDAVQKIIEKQFPEKGVNSRLSATSEPLVFTLVPIDGDRICPKEKRRHSSQNATLTVVGSKVKYHCWAEACLKTADCLFRSSELEHLDMKRKAHLKLIDQTTLENVGDLKPELFDLIHEHFKHEATQLGFNADDSCIPADKKEEFELLNNRMWHEINALINHFIVRLTNGMAAHSVIYSYVPNERGTRILKKANPVNSNEFQTRFDDVNFRFPTFRDPNKKRDDDDEISYFAFDTMNLFSYLTKSMDRMYKVVRSDVEWYPALEKDDPRSQKERGNRLNTFVGLDIPPQECKEWYAKLSPSAKSEVDRDIGYLDWLHREVLCGGNAPFHEYALTYVATKYFQPWRKLGSNLVITGPQGIGKSVFYSDLYHKLFGTEHAAIIESIEDLNPAFNNHLSKKLVVTCEEVNGAHSFKAKDRLKSQFGNQKNRVVTTKYKDAKVQPVYSNGIFLSNEDDCQAQSDGERRYKAIRGKDVTTLNRLLAGIQSKDKETKLTDSYAFYHHIANLDPRVLGYLLCKREAKIADFDEQRDAPRTVETVKQVIASFDKMDNVSRVQGFWFKFLADTLHFETKGSPVAFASSVRQILRNDEKRSSSDLIQDMKNLAYDQASLITDPLWVFKPKVAQWKRIKELLETPRGEAKTLSDTQLAQDIKEVVASIEGHELCLPRKDRKEDQEWSRTQNEGVKSILTAAYPKEVSKYLTFPWTEKQQFYTDYFSPYLEKIRKINKHIKVIPANTFWKFTLGIFTSETLKGKRMGSKRISNFSFTCLEDARTAFSKNVLRKINFFQESIEQGELDY